MQIYVVMVLNQFEMALSPLSIVLLAHLLPAFVTKSHLLSRHWRMPMTAKSSHWLEPRPRLSITLQLLLCGQSCPLTQRFLPGAQSPLPHIQFLHHSSLRLYGRAWSLCRIARMHPRPHHLHLQIWCLIRKSVHQSVHHHHVILLLSHLPWGGFH